MLGWLVDKYLFGIEDLGGLAKQIVEKLEEHKTLRLIDI